MALQQVLLCSDAVCATVAGPNAGVMTADSKVHIEICHCAPCMSAKVTEELLAVVTVTPKFC